MLDQKLQLAKDSLLHQLVDADSTSVPQLVREAFDDICLILFEDLETGHKETKYARDHFYFVVSLYGKV